MNSNEDKFLTEYAKAQDSAEHHDNLIWVATGVAWTGNIVLFALAISKIGEPYFQHLIVITSTLGILIMITATILAVQLINVKNQKYDRCKKIEGVFQFEQHSQLRYHPGPQKISYLVTAFVFILLWIGLLYYFVLSDLIRVCC